MNDNQTLIRKKITTWKSDHKQFCWDCFGVTLDTWQDKAFAAFINNDIKIFRLSLQACAGPGKSALLAMLGWWFLSTQGEKGNHPKGAVVAITQDNLKDNLWAEFSKWQQRSKFLLKMFTWTKTRIYANDHPNTWFLSARSFNKSANPEEQGRTLSGVHSKYVLFLIDESGDIPVQVLKSAEQALSTADKVFGRIVQAGNPTSHSGMLHAAQSLLADKWHVVRITGDPDDPDRSPRIDIKWAEDQIKTYGRDDPWVASFILGRFPVSSINTLLTVDQIHDAMTRGIKEEDYMHSQKRLGIDVARFGMDSTIIFPRQGLRAFNYVEMRKSRTPEIAARVMLAKTKWGSEMEFVDGTGGFGSGVIDSLIQANTTPQEIHFSSASSDPKYFNKRAEMWFELSEWVKRGGVLPNCPHLKKELAAPTYSFKKGKLILESKDQIKKRLGYSPDRADGLALTFAMHDMPASNPLMDKLMGNGHQSEYDPLN